jgi:hypothetical protein
MSNCPRGREAIDLSGQILLSTKKSWFADMINNYKIKCNVLSKKYCLKPKSMYSYAPQARKIFHFYAMEDKKYFLQNAYIDELLVHLLSIHKFYLWFFLILF